MDLKMKSEAISSSSHPIWDVDAKNGIIPIIIGDEEDFQTATLSGFLELGSIPQLPNAGVPWTEFLTKKITFGELDSLIRDSIQNAGKSEFYPKYDITDDVLTMTVGKDI